MNTKNEMTQKERLLKFLQYLKMGQNAFENSASIPTGSICHWKNGNVPPKACEKIFNTYPQLNKIWLLTGEGSMLISSVVPTERTPRDDRETTEKKLTTEDSSDAALKEKIEELLNTTLAAYKEKIEELQYIIDLQKDYIDGNKNTIAQLEDFIKHLKAENHELKKAQHTVTVPHAKSV